VIWQSGRYFHQLEARIEAHVFIAFLAYCLHVTLARRLQALAPGLTPRSVFEKFAAVPMIDVHLPTTDGRELTLTRHKEPEPELKLLLDKHKLELPAQPPPKTTVASSGSPPGCGADLRVPCLAFSAIYIRCPRQLEPAELGWSGWHR